jgi:hypothetical protein
VEKKDPGAILFNLSKHRSFPCYNHSYAISCGKFGPVFGFDDLTVGSPFNAPNACSSKTLHVGFFANYIVAGYGITENSEGINELTNKKSIKSKNGKVGRSEFTITEIEVWGVTFKE